MLTFIAILFILAITFFIGQYVGRSVPDELDYVEYVILAIFLVMLGTVFLRFGWFALLVVILVPLRKYLPYALLSGVIIGVATKLSIELQIIIFACAIILNFFLGTQKHLGRNIIVQLCAALIVAL